MRLLLSYFIATLFLTLAAPAAEDASTATPHPPFIERVKPDDYFDAEKLFPEAFSRTNELVVLRTSAAQPASVLAIKRSPGGEGYTLMVQIASADAPGGWLKIDEQLDAAFGQQVLRAFELKLHRQVALSKFKRRPSKTDTDIWLYQRLSGGRVAAALITVEAILNSPDATAFTEDFLRNLEKLIGTEGEARTAQLQKIDRAAAAIILGETR